MLQAVGDLQPELSLGIFHSQLIFTANNKTKIPTYSYSKIGSLNKRNCMISLNANIGILNGVELTKSTPSYWGGDGVNMTIGCRIGSAFSPVAYAGIINDIRIYDRKLTKEEILQNQELDKKRYFGGSK